MAAVAQDIWDAAMTWIDDVLVADGGARVIDATGPAVDLRIPGAAGRYFSDGRRLFSADQDGLHAWDPGSGERRWTEAGFSPAWS